MCYIRHSDALELDQLDLMSRACVNLVFRDFGMMMVDLFRQSEHIAPTMAHDFIASLHPPTAPPPPLKERLAIDDREFY